MYKRVTIFSGHYGSGKTNIAINYALKIKKSGADRVAIADLDIVNPYFRTKDSGDILEKYGVKLISSDYAGTNVDVPALPAETYSLTDDKNIISVIDVGGDDRGALALGRYIPSFKEENNYEFLFVINKFRPLSSNASDTIEIMKEIEAAARLKFTGIVNNSNLGDETTSENIISSLGYASEISELSALPIRMTTVREDLLESVKEYAENAIPIKIYVEQSWSLRR